jgi:uncharacterized protein (UPF0332 family)
VPPRTHTGLRGRFSDFARSSPTLGAEVGRELSQLETGRTDADYGEPEITPDKANEAIIKAEHVVDVAERALERGPSSKDTEHK